MTTRPSTLINWTDGGSAVQQPPASLQATGYTAGDTPDPKNFNYILWHFSNWIAYLASAEGATVLQTTLDASTRLVGGGTWSWDSTSRTLAWTSAANLAVPTLPLSANTLASGSIVIPVGSVAYVQANVPLTTTGSISSGSTAVNNVGVNMSIAVGATVSGDGIAQGTTVTAVDQNTLTLSAPATATNDNASLTFTTQGALTAQVSDVSSLTPNVNTTLFAYGHSDYAAIGVNCTQMTLRNGEQKTLNGLTGYTGMVCANAGQAFNARQALYISNGSADGRNAGQAYLADASAAFGATRAQFVGFASHKVAAGECAALVSMGTMTGFGSLTTGSVYYLDPTTPGGIVASRTTTTGQYAVPVGFALDSNSLRINPEATRNLVAVTPDVNVAGNLAVSGTSSLTGALTVSAPVSATSFASSKGFSQQVNMGVYTDGTPNAASQARFFNVLGAGSSPVYMTRTWVADRSGSVLALKLTTDTFYNNNTTVDLLLQRDTTTSTVATFTGNMGPSVGDNPNGVSVAQVAAPGAASFFMQKIAAKGGWPFLAGDVLTMRITTSGTTTSARNSSAILKVQADMTVETAQ